MPRRVYSPAGPVIAAFHQDPSFFRGIRGPIGSGKTVACCYELLNMAQQQKAHPITGWRRTKFAVIRNTYRMLETSTVKTWLEQFPEHIFGKFKMSPPFRHLIRDEASKFEMEVIFLALDDEKNVRDLLSTEWTGAFINEARELPKGLVDNIISRMRRYPPKEKEVGFLGATRPGVVADTNAPGLDHWWPVLAGDAPAPEHWSQSQRELYIKPKNWRFFTQPPALIEQKLDGQVQGYAVNPEAENAENLHEDYYPDQWYGKEPDWIDVYLMNRYKTIKAGKPVYPDFDQESHVYKVYQKYNPEIETFGGIDFGLTPACVLVQRYPTGHYIAIAEFVALDMDIPHFAQWLGQEIGKMGIRMRDIDFWGDPSGDNRDQQAASALQLMHAGGVYVKKAPTNDPSIRVAAVNSVLTDLRAKRPRLKINPNLYFLTQGFIHGYRYRKRKVAGADSYEDKPDKNHAGGKYTHIHDALQYAMLGAGEGRKLLGAKKSKVVTLTRADRNFNVWGNHGPTSNKRASRW